MPSRRTSRRDLEAALADARGQLSLRYGHFALGKTLCLLERQDARRGRLGEEKGEERDHPALTFCQYLPRALRLPLSRRRASFVTPAIT